MSLVAPRSRIPLAATARPEALRVALIAGTLRQGGAEKQAVYMARALREAGVDVRVYSLTQGEAHEASLLGLGMTPRWFGRGGNPLIRLASLRAALRDHRPHILQACHFFAGPYATAAAWLGGGISIGSLRNDFVFEMRDSPGWGKWALRMPSAIIANSEVARRNAQSRSGMAGKVHVVPNVIDLDDFDAKLAATPPIRGQGPVALAIGSLFAAKRFDRFLEALAMARRDAPALRGILVGDGPERARLEQLAGTLGLLPGGVEFAGRRDDVPALMAGASMLALSSDHEGFPNVVMEAMAARLPVVATPAGDSAALVEHGRTGYIVPHEDVRNMANHMASLARFPRLARDLGESGRDRVERDYGYHGLLRNLLGSYGEIARRRGRGDLLNILATMRA